MTKKRVFWLAAVLYPLFGIFFYWLWLKQVDPTPEWEALGRIYWPILEYWRSSLEIGNDYSFLVPRCYRFPYPEGSAIFAWLVAALQLQKLFLGEPWFFNIILILVLCMTPFFIYRNHCFWKRFTLLALAIYFFPISQICFKQFSLNAWSVIFFFSGFLFFRSYLVLKRPVFLWPATIFMLLAGAMKHLGLLYTLNLLLVYIFWSFLAKKSDWRVYVSFLIALLGALPFYSRLALGFYPLHQVLHHNQSMSFMVFLLSAVFVSFGYCVIVVLANRLAFSTRRLKLARTGLLLLFFCLLCVLQLIFLPDERAIIPLLLCGFVLMFAFGYYNSLHSKRAFFYWFVFSSYINMALLFASNVGRVSYVFFLPLLILLFLSFVETTKQQRLLLYVGLFMVFSNLIPSLNTMQKLFGIPGRNLYFVVYNSLHNPLGWQNCPVARTKKEFLYQVSQRSFPMEPLFVVETFASALSRQLEVYPGNLVLHTPILETLSFLSSDRKGWNVFQLVQKWLQEGDSHIWHLIEQQQLPLLLRPIRPLPSPVDHFRHFRLSDIVHTKPDYLNNPLILAWFFNEHIFDLLTESGQLNQQYEKILLPDSQNPFVELYILKSLPLQELDQTKANTNLQHLIIEYNTTKDNLITAR